MRPLLFAVTLAASLTTAAAAQEPDLSAAEKAVVLVRVQGVDAQTNAARQVQGTGFFISKDGFVVTSYHLLSKLGEVHEGTVSWEIEFANNHDKVQASILWPMASLDLLVLYANIGKRDVQILARGTHKGVTPAVTTLYTFGYPNGWQYSTDKGFIKSFGAAAPILVWSTNMTFKEGQSGSPICRSDLSVIAVARGDDAEANSIGVIVPIRPIPDNYWDER
jgi:hypothetical protein